MAKSTVFKIVSGIAVVAVVVVVALAIAGVFSPNLDNTSGLTAYGEETAQTQFLRDIATDHVFEIKGSEAIGDINSYVTIAGGNEAVELEKIEIDASKNIYGVTAKNGFLPKLAYEITLSNGATFTDEALVGLSKLMFRTVGEQSEVMDINDLCVTLDEEDVAIDADSGSEVIMTVLGAAGAAYAEGTVFLVGNIVDGMAYKAIRASQVDGDDELVYVEDADLNDVFAEIDIFKAYEISEDDVIFNEEASIQSIMQSDFFLDAYALLFGSTIIDTNKVKLSFDVSFDTSKINVDFDLVFRNFIPGDAEWEIALSVKNVITPEPTLNFQKNPKAFDFSVDMDIVTTAGISFKVGYNAGYINTVNSLIDELKALAGADVSKGVTFFTWVIPVGPLPICITYEMGVALSFDFVGQLGFEVTNSFSTLFGVVYVNDEVKTFSNYDNKFEVGNLALSGKAGAKFGITNAVGISAYGVVTVNLGVEVGVYADLAGRVSLNMSELINEKQFNIIPAYYLETGIYLDMDLAAKVFTFNIGKFNVLSKKWPLYSLGYKYIPIEFASESETIFMAGTYAYLTSFAADSFNLLSMSDAGVVAIAYDQFEYDLTDAPNITLTGNKIEVKPTVSEKFEDVIVITSKVNKELSKTLIIKKMAEAPSTENDTITYDKVSGGAAKFDVLLNTSKFVGLVGDVAINDAEYLMKGSELIINANYMSKLNYGTYGFVFESSKGNLNLYVKVISSEPIVALNSSVNFDMSSPSNALFEIDLKGNSITSISQVNANYYTYQTATNSLCIYGSYLMTLGTGAKSFTVNYSNGSSETLTVNIADSRLPKLATTSYEFLTSSNRKVEVPMTLYSASFVKVSQNGSDLSITNYSREGNSILLNDTYLKGLGEGLYTFEITTSQNTLSFTVNVSASIAAVIPVKAATFDKANPNNVSFEVITQATTLSLSGNDVIYTFGANGFTIDGAYLAGLALGTYNFTVSGANVSSTLTVEVINTKAPSIAAGEYTFNKADPADVVIDINLEAATLASIDGLSASDYGYADGKLTIAQAALSAKAYGATEFVINTSVNSFAVVVDIYDTRAIKLVSNASIGFNKVLGNTLTVAVELYDKEFVSVSGSGIRAVNYRYNEGVVTISNEYAYGLADGNYELDVNTTGGDLRVNIGVTGTADLKLTTVGAGTAVNPYKIFTVAQMNEFAAGNKDYSGQYFALGADIDWGFATIAPIGSESKPFKGVFDGNGYAIKNITIQGVADKYTGLFAYNDGTIKNVTISEAKVVFADHGSVGAGIVVGKNSGTIDNVKVSGSINAESKSWQDIMNAYFDIGGVAGFNSGTIKDADVTVQINASVKGLSVMGINLFGKKSNINVGAIVGYLKTGSVVESSVSRGNIVATATSNNITCNGWYGESDGAAGQASFIGTTSIN